MKLTILNLDIVFLIFNILTHLVWYFLCMYSYKNRYWWLWLSAVAAIVQPLWVLRLSFRQVSKMQLLGVLLAATATLVATVSADSESGTGAVHPYGCYVPTPPHYGYINGKRYDYYDVGYTIYFECYYGYKLYGSSWSKCYYDEKSYKAKWSHPIPVCKSKFTSFFYLVAPSFSSV